MRLDRFGPVMRLRLVADLCLVALFVVGAFQALGFSRLALYMPLFASAVGAILASALFVRDLIRGAGQGGDKLVSGEATSTAVLAGEGASPGESLRRATLQLGWFIAYAVGIAVVGVIPASGVFVAIFLLVEARMRWYGVVLSAAATVGALMLIGEIMNLRWPETVWELFG